MKFFRVMPSEELTINMNQLLGMEGPGKGEGSYAASDSLVCTRTGPNRIADIGYKNTWSNLRETLTG